MIIQELAIGDIAYNNGSGYAIVSACVHGRKYYAYMPYPEDTDPIYVVDDMDVNHIPCCS